MEYVGTQPGLDIQPLHGTTQISHGTLQLPNIPTGPVILIHDTLLY